MQITIHSIHFDADKKLLNFINKKVEKLMQFDDELIYSEVFLKLENTDSRANKIVEIKVNTESNDFMQKRKIKMEKKKLLLRIDPKLHDELRRWADDDFRSINAQIEFLLRKAVAENRRESSD